MMLVWIAFQLAIIAYVYSKILTKPEMILGDAYGYLSQVAVDFPKTEWILKPLILCPLCVGGQLALWTFILYGWLHLELVRSIIDVLFFLSITILLVQLLLKTNLHD
jgi:hypothetical protein